jgi:hypothetical protein
MSSDGKGQTFCFWREGTNIFVAAHGHDFVIDNRSRPLFFFDENKNARGYDLL